MHTLMEKCDWCQNKSNQSELKGFVFVFIFLYIIHFLYNIKMSPKVIKDVHQPRSNNIKNIYIQKINSLMKMSKDTIGKSQIEALNQTNRYAVSQNQRKKIKKHLSEAEKNNIRLQKNRQSAKKARQRKKIYVKLLEQQEKRLTDVLQKTQNVEKVSSDYVEHLWQKKNELIMNEERPMRKSSDGNIDKVLTKNRSQNKKGTFKKLQDKIALLKNIVEELTELSKYAYWKQNRPGQNQNENSQMNSSEEDFFNIQEVLADIEVVQMKPNDNFDINLDDLLNVPYQDESIEDQRERFDIKSLITDQYETVSRCLNQLGLINLEGQQLLKNSSIYKKNVPPGQDFKNPELAQFKKKNTIVPEYEIKKIKPRRIDSLNSLSSANRSMMSKNRSLFSLNNFFINMEEAETKILSIDRAIEQINRILAFKDQEQKQCREQQFSVEKNQN